MHEHKGFKTTKARRICLLIFLTKMDMSVPGSSFQLFERQDMERTLE